MPEGYKALKGIDHCSSDVNEHHDFKLNSNLCSLLQGVYFDAKGNIFKETLIKASAQSEGRDLISGSLIIDIKSTFCQTFHSPTKGGELICLLFDYQCSYDASLIGSSNAEAKNRKCVVGSDIFVKINVCDDVLIG